MAPGKDNMSASVSILTQRQLDKFVRKYKIPLDLHPVLPSKDETIYPFRQWKFPFYTRVCNFANYRVPFSRFLIRVLQFFRVHISQVNPFGLSRISHFEISCRAQDRRPDLDVFRYFYEFITAGDWYTFAHRKGDRDWPVIRRKRDRSRRRRSSSNEASSSFGSGDPSCSSPNTSEQAAIEAASSIPTPTKGAAGSSGSQAGKKSILDDVNSDPEVRSLDEALQYRPSISLKSKGVVHEVEQQALVRKRKTESLQIRSSDDLPMPRLKKVKKGSSYSSSDVMVELDEHLTGGKFSMEEAARARSEPTPSFSGGFLPINE
ncbi:hypothetical protein HanIR_Chr05g0220821 [Helianthus annuus]|nr:hypothetical protein HanIR_Chr05g0220821 [Helianthus annuus]KAJ0749596.1 hypothetical protein HanLR1_Chr05g0171821 [Helianthus annuus]